MTDLKAGLGATEDTNDAAQDIWAAATEAEADRDLAKSFSSSIFPPSPRGCWEQNVPQTMGRYFYLITQNIITGLS